MPEAPYTNGDDVTLEDQPTAESQQLEEKVNNETLKLPAALENASLSELTRDQLLEVIELNGDAGTRISFSGKTNARRLARKVRPRITREVKEQGYGDEELRARNRLLEGDNLQGMSTLYRERGRIDLIITDPPFNTGKDFRYNDRWEDDPNDTNLGDFVSPDDTAKHTKWMRFMLPRLQMMKAMLRPAGVLAICIDHRELFRLGPILDELFREENRIGIINWEKSAASRPDNNHVSTSTEYVLVYAKDIDKANTESLERVESDNQRYSNPDNDPDGDWREGNLTARTWSKTNDYAIQSPFTGKLHYPAGGGAWRHPKRNIKAWLEQWGAEYEERDIGDERGPGRFPLHRPAALMVKGCDIGEVHLSISQRASEVLQLGPWPFIWFGRDGLGRPRAKTYLQKIRKGKVPVTYWADEDFSFPVEIGPSSWDYTESGRSSDGVAELTAIVGKGHGFETVKPLKLFMKIVQLWCPPSGIVLDPFAGSGTTGHAVLALNQMEDAERRFILIEQGRPERGDSYARTLTAVRLRNVISGEWAAGESNPLPGGFSFGELGKKVDAPVLLKMERDEMADTVIASHFDANRRRGDQLVRVEQDAYKYLVAHNNENEGFFLIWDGTASGADFTENVYEACCEEAVSAGLKPSPHHVYARLYRYQTDGVRFYQIPDRILADFGLDLSSEPFAEDIDE